MAADYITGAPNKITKNEVAYNSAVGESTFTKIGSSINFIVENYATQIGDIVQSMLTEAQFQTLRGNHWVLMDGRNVVGSDYAILTGFTNLPDARGAFLRAKNNGRIDGNEDPGGERVLGNYQLDDLKSHSHTYTAPDAGSGGVFGSFVNGFETEGQQTLTTGGAETRPKNVAVNFFIKINNVPTP